MEVSVVEDLGAPPDSWEVADLEATVSRLILSSSSSSSSSSKKDSPSPPHSNARQPPPPSSSSSSSASREGSGQRIGGVSEDLVNSVDQFLREALQNPRERLSVLRIEQDVEKFILDPSQQQMEFQQLPTSYLRLAAHRVAQHYSLQSTVLLDNNLLDGSGSRIIICKTGQCRLPSIRLADIPVTLPSEEKGAIKVAIKQRPQKRSPAVGSTNLHSMKANNSRSVEERKEEYNKARARIFNSSSSSGVSGGRTENVPRSLDNIQGISKAEERFVLGESDINHYRGWVDSSTSSSLLDRSRTEEPVATSKTNNRVAIFRDREVERKDPDYDRNYDRYMQRFDPGFGFNGGPYTIQPMYSPTVNYNTEFPQLGSGHQPSISSEHHPRPIPQHLPGLWAPQSTPARISYGHPDAMMTPFSHNHVGARSTSALYLHSAQYPCQHPGMPFINPREQFHQSFSQHLKAQKQVGKTHFKRGGS